MFIRLLLPTPMGNIFSRKLSLREQLLNLDEQIERQTTRIEMLHRQRTRMMLAATAIFALIVPAISMYVHFHGMSYLVLALPTVLFALFQGALCLVFSRLADHCQHVLRRMRKTQRDQIEQLKRDVDYMETLKIVQKYDASQRKGPAQSESVVSTRSLTDRLAQIVLGDNPQQMCALICEKCYAHNGLVFPKQLFNRRFKCLACSTVNVMAGEDELVDRNDDIGHIGDDDIGDNDDGK